MKKIVSIILALMVVFAVVACGNKKNTDKSAEPTASATAPTESIESPQSNTDVNTIVSDPKKPQVSENKTVVSKNAAPKVYVIMPDMGDMSYHLENCANLAGKETKEMAWDVVQMIGLWQCPVCNPPRYENYKNAQ